MQIVMSQGFFIIDSANTNNDLSPIWRSSFFIVQCCGYGDTEYDRIVMMPPSVIDGCALLRFILITDSITYLKYNR